MQSHFDKSAAVCHGLSHRCSNIIGVVSARLCILKASLTISGLLASFFFVSQETGNLAYVYTHGTSRNCFALGEIHCQWVVSLGVLRAPPQWVYHGRGFRGHAMVDHGSIRVKFDPGMVDTRR
jgi:hypothetical protein